MRLSPILIWLAAVLLTMGGAHNPQAQEEGRKSTKPEVRRPPADYGKYAFSMRSIDGGKLELGGFAGTTVLVTIWSPGCEPCEREADALVRVYARFRASGFEILGVAVRTTETDVRMFQQKHAIKWPLGIDDDILKTYGMYGLPDHYLFGADGTFLKHYVGRVREGLLRSDLEAQFRAGSVPRVRQK
ncbi:MAG TPA: TlpA disulfide reductase family protein [Bacteroidota bacterium]|nr:TlpA disulfide reductase family protein [Bacteroidota bacterium]